LKARLKEAIAELQNYPIALRRLDVEKLEGLKRLKKSLQSTRWRI
jgi:hypothetical protein